jgi:hypothetical protein
MVGRMFTRGDAEAPLKAKATFQYRSKDEYRASRTHLDRELAFVFCATIQLEASHKVRRN